MGWRSDRLVWRLALLGAIFSLELTAVTLWLDGAALSGSHGLSGFIGAWGAWILRAVVGFAVFFLTFSWLNYRPALLNAARASAGSGVDWRFFIAHAVSISLFGILSPLLYGALSSSLISNLAAAAWLATGLSAIAFGGFALIPPSLWLRIARNTGYLWMIAFIAVILACLTGNSSRSLWPWAAGITFRIVHVLVSPFIPDLVVHPATMEIGSQRFLVEIAPECSGLEGIGLMLAFGVTWLTFFRKQCRFPQALTLLPAGAALIFLLNSVRIAALILIGNAGAVRIAAGGFHSQAGWIAFNLIALGFTVAAGKIPWLSNTQSNAEPVPASRPAVMENPTAAWLMPFVMILAAGMISRALTGDFEWLYPLRFFAAAATLVFFRRTYAASALGIDWFGPVVGVVAFIVWVAPDWLSSVGAETMPTSLAMAEPFARNIWLTFRVLAAVVTVPIAEELAFRGFLYRRLLSADFESVSLRRFSWLALLASSLIFGALHGSRWFVGAIAGVLYALALLRRGRIADAIVAHAVTNALIAVDVLAFHHWELW
ncbi:MAG TPA: exosortase E/protease, VPEID-CTERM system [Bryobacteraceae bacterium]